MKSLRVFHIRPGKSVEELAMPPDEPPREGYLWLACSHDDFVAETEAVQTFCLRLGGIRILDLHVSDLSNLQLPSHLDYTSDYDVLVFRRLALHDGLQNEAASTREQGTPRRLKEVAVALGVETVPVGFVLFDRLLLSVHPEPCVVHEAYIRRLLSLARGEPRQPGSLARLPASPAELMLRVTSLMVDGFLDLRKHLTRQLEHWQQRLMRPRKNFDRWDALLRSRQVLHYLDECCEDQSNALASWMDTLDDWPVPGTKEGRHEREQLLVRGRDVLEHIERVAHHVRRLEQSAETAVQIHFSIQSNRTNDVMRALTAVTAVFLPLNLIAGIFGMNFDSVPWLHGAHSFWITMGIMLLIAFGLLGYFVRKNYLSSTEDD
ncbi:magnesium transporter CorA [Bordetella sp. J329]|nr:magnesium transporter CorA [Bordetella sp. J329]